MSRKATKRPFQKVDEFEAHFPEKEVNLGGGLVVTMRPMCIKDGAAFMRGLAIIRRAISMKTVPVGEEPLPAVAISDLDSIITEQVLPMLPFCVDANFDALPIFTIPVLVKTWLDQNMNDELLKNYSALDERTSELSERVNDFTGASRLPEESID